MGLKTVTISVFSYMTGAIDEMVIILVIMMILDYITGVISGAINRRLNSKLGIIGIMKKVLLICVVLLAMLIDYVFMMNNIFIRGYLTVVVLAWLIANEALSIIENTANAGVHYPPVILSALALLNKRDRIRPPIKDEVE